MASISRILGTFFLKCPLTRFRNIYPIAQWIKSYALRRIGRILTRLDGACGEKLEAADALEAMLARAVRIVAKRDICGGMSQQITECLHTDTALQAARGIRVAKRVNMNSFQAQCVRQLLQPGLHRSHVAETAIPPWHHIMALVPDALMRVAQQIT